MKYQNDNQNEELISIIMSVYNENIEFLNKSINSILNQTYTNIQFVVVNDDPENELICNALKKYLENDKRINIIKNEKNIGLTASLNNAIKYCDGVYIARMDSDDISEATRIQEQLIYMKKNNLDIVGCETRRINENGDVVIKQANKAYSPECIRKCLRYDNCVPHPSWIVRKKVYKELNGYRDMPACEDYDFLLRAVKHGYKVGICNKILLNYRINTKGISKSNILKQRIATNYISNHIWKIDDLTDIELKRIIDKKCTTKKQEQYRKGIKKLDEACFYCEKNKIKSITTMLQSVICSKYVLSNLYRMIRVRIIRLIYKNNFSEEI